MNYIFILRLHGILHVSMADTVLMYIRAFESMNMSGTATFLDTYVQCVVHFLCASPFSVGGIGMHVNHRAHKHTL